MSELIRAARIRDGGEIEITSLAENERVHLIATGWDGIGYFRWHTTRAGRRCKCFYTISPRTGIAQRVTGYDQPRAFRPLAPLRRGAPPPAPAPAERDPIATGALAAFEARLLLAIRVDAAERDPDRRLLRVKTTNYQTSAGPGDYAPAITTRFQPTIEQRQDAEIVLRWIALIDADQRRALWLKALGFSIKSIAERMRTNVPKTKKIINNAVQSCRVLAGGEALCPAGGQVRGRAAARRL